MTISTAKINDVSGVWFLSADFGGLTLKTRDECTFWSKNVDELVSFVKEKGMASEIFGSSSMDFADEEGFETQDGADLLWDRVIESL